MTKGNHFKYINTNETFSEALGVEVSLKLRNTIGHNDVVYDTALQEITYILDPGNKSKKLTEYLL